MKNNEILWEQSLEASFSWLFMGIETSFIIFILGMLLMSVYQLFKFGSGLDKTSMVELVEIIGYGGIYLYGKMNQIFVAETLHYQIKPMSLVYKWGIKQGTSIEIPFKDITAINLVEYHSKDYSTIYLVTKKDYKIHKLNFDNNSPRHTYTFEKVKKGKEVYQLMMERWNLSRA